MKQIFPVNFIIKESLTSFIWPEGFEYEKAYVSPLMGIKAKQYIANVETEMALLQADAHLFPVSINDKEYGSSYVCSPYNACILYSKEEMKKLQNRWLELPLHGLTTLFGRLLKFIQVNKIVCVNNWLLSTNLYPNWDGDSIHSITVMLKTTYADHSIMFRSLNMHSNEKLMDSLKNEGYIFVPSRQVYIFDKKLSDYIQKKNTKWDLKKLANTTYQQVSHNEILPSDYPRIVELYNFLYLEKYSLHNPQFTEECIRNWHQNSLLSFKGLRNREGILDGIVGYFIRNDVVTAPLVGYETKLPQSVGLYRMLMTIILKHTEDEDLVLNLSSGASDFKRLRGAKPYIEYSAVYIEHLPLYRQCIWKTLSWVLNRVGVPILERYEL